MKFDKAKLEEMLKLPDDKLWEQVVAIGASHGVRMPTKPPSKEQMARLRSCVSDGARPNIPEALKLLNAYRKETR